MSKDDKLLKKFLEKPVRNDISIDEITAVAKVVDAEIIRGGKHSYHFVHRKSNTVIPIPIHGKTVKAVYIRMIAKIIESYLKENK